ncbi:hypothetical protein [Enterovibrio norvegicus]|uniref:hypothetical protein n=1 Tax=Enterovibrio norvegicus TaxID=188144 RepID=UPI00352F0C20
MNSNEKNIGMLVSTAHFHGLFGVAFLLPLLFLTFQDALVAYSESRASNDLSIFIPFLLMLPLLIALQIQMFSKMRVSIAKFSLRLLACGVSYAAFFVCNRYFGYEVGLFAATFVPYFYVRVFGKGLLNKDLALTDEEVVQANAD